MTSKKFEINTEPHEAYIGEDTYLFEPEAYSEELLDAWATLRAATAADDDDTETDDEGSKKPASPEVIKERNRAANQAVREFISSMMLPESATVFADKRYPDRILIELQRWLMEVYGLRPTGASSDSSTQSPEPTPTGEPSTGDSSTEESMSLD